jgi:hypothetical protein
MKWLLGALQSKTMWFATALSGLGWVQAHWGTFTQYLSPTTAGYVATGIGIAVAGLRMITKVPLPTKA